MAKSEINLDGGETAVLKALGLHGAEVTGKELVGRVQGIENAELIGVLKGLISMGYVDADQEQFRDVKEIEELGFRVSAGWAKELREALAPQQEKKSRRVRRE